MTLAKRDSSSRIAQSKGLVSSRLSRRLPYYLTPDEAHSLIDATDSERDRLLPRLLWEAGVRISEATALRLEDVGREGIRVLGKGRFERVVVVQDGLTNGTCPSGAGGCWRSLLAGVDLLECGEGWLGTYHSGKRSERVSITLLRRSTASARPLLCRSDSNLLEASSWYEASLAYPSSVRST